MRDWIAAVEPNVQDLKRDVARGGDVAPLDERMRASFEEVKTMMRDMQGLTKSDKPGR